VDQVYLSINQYLFNRGSMPLSISFITGQLRLGGAEKQLYLLARGLYKIGWQVSVISMSHSKGEYWEQPLRQLGIPVYGIRMDLSHFHRLIAVRRILKALRISVVHSWTLHTNFYSAAGGRLSGVPIRLGSERSNHQSSRKSLGIRYGLCLWGQDALVVNSRQEAAFLRSYRPNLKVEFVPNGVETPQKQMDLQQRNDLRERLGVKNASPIIGAVGTMVFGKGFVLLIKALQVLARCNIPFTLIFVGDGPMLSDLKHQSNLSFPKDRVLFTGAIPNATVWYPAFDVLCMPSIHEEGMPNVIMEGSAAGLPVVASQVGAVPDLVEDGITGFLVPPNQIDPLADRLQKLLVDPELRQRMGQAGIEKMDREFNVEAMVTRMKKVYEDRLLEKGLA
jgi:glycosyltransferase involved in cell wall biosynthesis